MIYAQTNYKQPQGGGNGGKPAAYTIAQIGCFITAFCNILSNRFVHDVTPIDVNNVFTSKGYYIDIDDGVKDDVGWSHITYIDSGVVVARTGSGVPPSNNCIIKVLYRSPNTGNMITHFSAVADITKGLIWDSWDGVTKSWNVYGGPVEWAEYTKPGAQAPSINSGVRTMDSNDGIEAYRTALHREPESAAARDHWNGKKFSDIANTDIRGSSEWQEQDRRLKTYDSLVSQLSASTEQIAKLSQQIIMSDKLQKQVDDLIAKNQVLTEQEAADKAAGDNFLRRLGQFISKYFK